MADAIRTVLAADSSHDTELTDIQARLRAWDMRSNTENTGAALANLTFEPIYEARFHHITPPDPVTAARDAAHYLTQHFHRLDPPWGEVLRLRRGDVDLPMDGANDVLRGIRWAHDPDGRLRANYGDGLMMVMDWAPDGALTTRVISQWGVSSHADSPRYNNQSALYARHEWRTLPPFH